MKIATIDMTPSKYLRDEAVVITVNILRGREYMARPANMDMMPGAVRMGTVQEFFCEGPRGGSAQINVYNNGSWRLFSTRSTSMNDIASGRNFESDCSVMELGTDFIN